MVLLFSFFFYSESWQLWSESSPHLPHGPAVWVQPTSLTQVPLSLPSPPLRLTVWVQPTSPTQSQALGTWFSWWCFCRCCSILFSSSNSWDNRTLWCPSHNLTASWKYLKRSRLCNSVCLFKASKELCRSITQRLPGGQASPGPKDSLSTGPCVFKQRSYYLSTIPQSQL